MVDQERLSPDQGEIEIPRIVFIKTWEDLLRASHMVLRHHCTAGLGRDSYGVRYLARVS